MRFFKAMVETVRSGGLVWGTEFGKPTQQQLEHFFLAASRCQPMIFEGLAPDHFGKKEGKPVCVESAPFPTFSVEFTQVHDTDKAACIMVDEVGANRCSAYAYFTDQSLGSLGVVGFDPDSASNIFQALETLLRTLRDHKVGLDPVKERIKLRSGNQTTTRTITKLVRVAPKNTYKSVRPMAGKPIDWTHRWLVRGHWVSLPGRIGKDRNGDYCVADWTWRKEHEKGLPDAPVVSKTRLVKNTEAQRGP